MDSQIETKAYVPTYRIKPELKQLLLKQIGDLPFNQIAGIFNALEAKIVDHQTLTQIINTIGQFSYVRVEQIIKNIGNLVEQIIDEPESSDNPESIEKSSK